jgi:hypothetical protein
LREADVSAPITQPQPSTSPATRPANLEDVAPGPVFDRKDAWFPIPDAIFEDDRYRKIVADPLRGWTWMRMCHDADRAWPAHPAVPRWVEQRVLDDLVAVGLVEILTNDTYSIPGLDVFRATAVKAGLASAAGAVRDASGHFAKRRTPTDEPTALVAVGPTALDQHAVAVGPTTDTDTDTETEKENDVSRTPLAESTGSSARNDSFDGEEDGHRPAAAPPRAASQVDDPYRWSSHGPRPRKELRRPDNYDELKQKFDESLAAETAKHST